MYEEFHKLLSEAQLESKLFHKPSDGDPLPADYVDLSNNPNDQVPDNPNRPASPDARITNLSVQFNNLDKSQQLLAQKFIILEEKFNNLAVQVSSRKAVQF